MSANKYENVFSIIVIAFFILVGIFAAYLLATGESKDNSNIDNKDTLKYSQVVEIVNDGKCEYVVYMSDEEQKIVHLDDCRGCGGAK